MENKKRDHCWSQFTENSSSKKYSTWSISQHGNIATRGGTE